MSEYQNFLILSHLSETIDVPAWCCRKDLSPVIQHVFFLFANKNLVIMIPGFSAAGTSNLSEVCGDYNNPWLYVSLFAAVFFPLAVTIILYTFEKLSGCHNKGVSGPRRLSLYYWICIWIFFTIEKICPSCCGYHGTYYPYFS